MPLTALQAAAHDIAAERVANRQLAYDERRQLLAVARNAMLGGREQAEVGEQIVAAILGGKPAGEMTPEPDPF